jgi:hypothetical protein
MLTGFKTRISILFNWTVAFLGQGSRAAGDHRSEGIRATCTRRTRASEQ